MTEPILVHGTAIAIERRAILLRGAPGSGKSDLALRLIDGGARLVADDQTELRRVGDRILARAPKTIAGLLEVRGVGILHLDRVNEAQLAMLVDLVPSSEVERLPEKRFEEVLGLAIPLITLAAFEVSAAAKVKIAHRELRLSLSPAILVR
ncbi:MAG: HPr kinase/phosphatase C-terminal domain-containing protein [Alphaproteobacteria bacterium]|nr:HPr kinase/phosphatase C-terminal domain-containing protein [Alphaproteobacteria bacterium]